MLRRLLELPTRVMLILCLAVFGGGISLSLMAIEEAGHQIEELENRWIREHVLTIYMSQADLMKARRAMMEADAQNPDGWLLRYEIAASRVETLESFLRNVTPAPVEAERRIAERYAAFVAEADAIIAAAQDPLATAKRIYAISAPVEALYPAAVDAALNRSQAMRNDLTRRNEVVVERARLVAMGAFAGLLAFSLALLIMQHQLRARNTRLEQVRDELARALESRRRFLAGVSHDFRTPLNAISGFTQLLLLKDMDTPEDKRRNFLQLILEAAKRLERMTSDLLDLARMERGAYELRQRDGVSVPDLLRGVAERFGPAAAAAQVRISGPDLEGCAQAGPGAGILRADPDALERAVSNLIDNAVKFSPPGATVRIGCDRRRRYLLIHVADEGPGIPPERLGQIWDVFSRGAGGPGGVKEGSGLGLAIARGLAEGHGGWISVRSQVGEGSRFTIHLPHPEEAAHRPARQEAGAEEGAGDGPPAMGAERA